MRGGALSDVRRYRAGVPPGRGFTGGPLVGCQRSRGSDGRRGATCVTAAVIRQAAFGLEQWRGKAWRSCRVLLGQRD